MREWLSDNWSNIITGIIALVIVVGVMIMMILDRPIPDLIGNVMLMVIAFFFGVAVPAPTLNRRTTNEAQSASVQANTVEKVEVNKP